MAIDFGSHRSSSIAAIAYVKLRAALGLEFRPPRVYDMVQQLAIVDEDVLDRFGVDTIEMGRGFALGDKYWVDWTLPDGTTICAIVCGPRSPSSGPAIPGCDTSMARSRWREAVRTRRAQTCRTG